MFEQIVEQIEKLSRMCQQAGMACYVVATDHESEPRTVQAVTLCPEVAISTQQEEAITLTLHAIEVAAEEEYQRRQLVDGVVAMDLDEFGDSSGFPEPEWMQESRRAVRSATIAMIAVN